MPRIDLKETINTYVEQSWQYEEESLMDYACSSFDWLTYYDKDIRRFLSENEISGTDIEWLMENAWQWVSEDTLTISHGYFSCSYEFSVASTQEIELHLAGVLPVPVSPWRREVINRNTDIYIADNGEYGYCSTDLLSVCLDARKIKNYLAELGEER